MRHSPKARLDAADYNGIMLERPADQVAIYCHSPVRPAIRPSSRTVGVLMPPLLRDRIVIDHGVHIAGGHQKTKPWLTKNRDAFRISPVRLADHAHRVTAGLQHPADNGATKTRMIHVGVSADIDEIHLVYAHLFHVFSADG